MVAHRRINYNTFFIAYWTKYKCMGVLKNIAMQKFSKIIHVFLKKNSFTFQINKFNWTKPMPEISPKLKVINSYRSAKS